MATNVNQVWVLDPKEWDIWFAGTPDTITKNGVAYTLKDWALREGADLTWNLAFFNFGTKANYAINAAYRTLEYVKGKNKIYGYDSSTSEKVPHLVLDAKNECGGWKLAVKDNIIQTKNIDAKSKRARNMNGITADGKYIHAQSTGKITESALANYVVNYVKKYYNTTVKLLLVQDSGGSTGVYSTISKIITAGEKEGTFGRPVATVVCAKRKAAIPPMTRILKYTNKKNMMNGKDIMFFQQVVTGLEIDGVYGACGKAQTKVIQGNYKLIPKDGIAGKDTYKAMGLKYILT